MTQAGRQWREGSQYLPATEIRGLEPRIRLQGIGIARQHDGAEFKHIATVRGLQRHVCVLFDQQDGQPVAVLFADQIEQGGDQDGA